MELPHLEYYLNEKREANVMEDKHHLKPCPFCGYMPKVDTTSRKYVEDQTQPVIQVRQLVKIECKRCFLTKDIVAVKLADIGTEEKVLRLIAKEGAREVLDYFWNNRIEL